MLSEIQGMETMEVMVPIPLPPFGRILEDGEMGILKNTPNRAR
jgi:hypothetical protein